MTAAGRQGGGPQGPERDEQVTLPATERLGRSGPGPVLVGLLVVAAFLVGVVRPWDWLGLGTVAPVSTDPGRAATPSAADGSARRSPDARASGAADAGGVVPAPAPVVEPTCAYPSSWRLAAIQDWGGRTARVWSVADAATGTGPDDPAIPFSTIASTSVTAVGWCAPVRGPERPPLTASGTLFRLDAAGPRAMPFDRLEPAAPDALGELWMPVAQSVGRRPPWPPGRYVIRLATPDGSYERYLGIEVVRAVRDAAPPASEEPAGSSEGPSPTAGPASSAAPSTGP